MANIGIEEPKLSETACHDSESSHQQPESHIPKLASPTAPSRTEHGNIATVQNLTFSQALQSNKMEICLGFLVYFYH